MLKRLWTGGLREVIIAIILAQVLRMGVAEARRVPTGSMIPTIHPGDRIFTEKLVWRMTGLHHGDIIVFDPPFETEDPYVKRLIGLPGDIVEVREGKVWLNGVAQSEPYIAAAPTYKYGPVTVPEGKVLVLGDNRNESKDSHEWGLLDEHSIIARALFRYWPPSRAGALK